MNLAWFVSHQIKDKEIRPAPESGHCYVHKMFNLGDIYFLKEKHPDETYSSIQNVIRSSGICRLYPEYRRNDKSCC